MRHAHPAVLLLRVASLVALAFTAAVAAEYYVGGHHFCEAGGGCDLVRRSEVGRFIAPLLPGLGLIAFPSLFVGSLLRDQTSLRWVGRLAMASGLGALGFLFLQAAVIHHYCWLCVSIDGAAALAGGAGAWIVWKKVGEPGPSSSLASYWWPLLFAAFTPFAWALTFPDPAIPEAVRELWDDDADVNVVEMADFECPYCRRLDPVLKGVLVDVDGDVHLARIVVPLSFHEHARDAARAYFCAERQEQAEAMASRLFAAEDLSREGTVEEARALALDVEAFEACLEDPRVEARIEEDLERSERAQMQGLPTVYIGERVIMGFPGDPAPYEEAVAAALRGESRRIWWWVFLPIPAGMIVSLVLARRAERAARAKAGPLEL